MKYKEIIISSFIYSVLVAVMTLKVTALLCLIANVLLVIIGALKHPNKLNSVTDNLGNKIQSLPQEHRMIVLFLSLAGLIFIYMTPIGLMEVLFNKEEK